MPVLTTLSQFEQYDLETEICDTVGCTRETAKKIVAEVFVPAFEARVRAALGRVVDAAVTDLERVHLIQKTPLDDVAPDDLHWYRAPAQALIREITALCVRDHAGELVAWLRDLRLRGAA